MTTPALSLSSLALIVGLAKPGCFEYDPVSKTYNVIPITSFNSITGVITVNFPRPGIYVFSGYNPSKYNDNFFMFIFERRLLTFLLWKYQIGRGQHIF